MLIKLTYLLVLIYTIEKGFASIPTEDDKKNVYLECKKDFWEKCQSTISEESLIIYEDDMEADNEEIRLYKFCMAEFYGFIKDNKIDIEKLINNTKKWFPMIQSHEFMASRFILTNCKNSAEQASDKYTIWQEFSKCSHREAKIEFE